MNRGSLGFAVVSLQVGPVQTLVKVLLGVT